MTYVCSVYEESLKCLISAGALDDCSAADLAPVVKGSVRMFRDVMAKMIPLPAEVLPLFKIIDFSVCDGMLLLHLLVRKPVFWVSYQVRHKPGCTTTQDG